MRDGVVFGETVSVVLLLLVVLVVVVGMSNRYPNHFPFVSRPEFDVRICSIYDIFVS